jgi:hypothetical protein
LVSSDVFYGVWDVVKTSRITIILVKYKVHFVVPPIAPYSLFENLEFFSEELFKIIWN